MMVVWLENEDDDYDGMMKIVSDISVAINGSGGDVDERDDLEITCIVFFMLKPLYILLPGIFSDVTNMSESGKKIISWKKKQTSWRRTLTQKEYSEKLH